MWAGVCGGLAEYFDVDSTLMRIIWVAVTIFTHGLGVPVYILLWLVMPRADRVNRSATPPADASATQSEANATATSASQEQTYWDGWPPVAEANHHAHRQRSMGIALLVLGALFLASNLGWFNWINIDWRMTWPLLLVAIGVALLAGQGRHWRR
jgi:phage shock protein PspC (stress-responsive transcriptional regulator)